MNESISAADDPFGFELPEPRGREQLYRWGRRAVIAAGCGVVGLVVLIVLSWVVVARAAKGQIYTAASRVPPADVVIVPGALVFPNGTPSLMLQDRIDAGVGLYQSGTVEHVLVSGDNSSVRYNEPVVMRNRAVDLGVPAADVTLDYAGLDTWDTCTRAKEQFGVTSAVVVTQHLYADRTAALCEAAGINTVVLSLEPPQLLASTRARGVLRETLAKVKAWGDMVRQPEPKYTGPYIGLVGSIDMPPGGHPPDWDWSTNAVGLADSDAAATTADD